MKNTLYRFVLQLLAIIALAAPAHATGVGADRPESVHNRPVFSAWLHFDPPPAWQDIDSRLSSISDFLQSREWPAAFREHSGSDWSQFERFDNVEHGGRPAGLPPHDRPINLHEYIFLPPLSEFTNHGHNFGKLGHDKEVGVSVVLPLPASVWLFGSGLVLLGWARVRRS